MATVAASSVCDGDTVCAQAHDASRQGNKSLASILWTQAANEYEHVPSMVELAKLFWTKDASIPIAWSWFRRAARFGNVEAIQHVAHTYAQGCLALGLAPNLDKSLRGLRDAATRGNSDSILELAYLYLILYGDVHVALEWLDKTSDEGATMLRTMFRSNAYLDAWNACTRITDRVALIDTWRKEPRTTRNTDELIPVTWVMSTPRGVKRARSESPLHRRVRPRIRLASPTPRRTQPLQNTPRRIPTPQDHDTLFSGSSSGSSHVPTSSNAQCIELNSNQPPRYGPWTLRDTLVRTLLTDIPSRPDEVRALVDFILGSTSLAVVMGPDRQDKTMAIERIIDMLGWHKIRVKGSKYHPISGQPFDPSRWTRRITERAQHQDVVVHVDHVDVCPRLLTWASQLCLPRVHVVVESGWSGPTMLAYQAIATPSYAELLLFIQHMMRCNRRKLYELGIRPPRQFELLFPQMSDDMCRATTWIPWRAYTPEEVGAWIQSMIDTEVVRILSIQTDPDIAHASRWCYDPKRGVREVVDHVERWIQDVVRDVRSLRLAHPPQWTLVLGTGRNVVLRHTSGRVAATWSCFPTPASASQRSTPAPSPPRIQPNRGILHVPMNCRMLHVMYPSLTDPQLYERLKTLRHLASKKGWTSTEWRHISQHQKDMILEWTRPSTRQFRAWNPTYDLYTLRDAGIDLGTLQ